MHVDEGRVCHKSRISRGREKRSSSEAPFEALKSNLSKPTLTFNLTTFA